MNKKYSEPKVRNKAGKWFKLWFWSAVVALLVTTVVIPLAIQLYVKMH